MAKKTEEALVEQRQGNTALAVADGADRNDRRGKGEQVDTKDLILPRLAAAQKTSPQIDPDKPEYLEDLKLYEMFNSLTGEVYGRGPVKFVVVRKLPRKAMQFDSDNKVVDFDVPWDDARCEFTAGEDGKRNKPVAIRFYEYLILLESGDIAVLSLKSTQVKTAKKLNSFIEFRAGASWLGMYAITSSPKPFGAFTAANFEVRPAGITPATLISAAEDAFKNTEGKKIDTQREVGDDDSFDTSTM